MVSYSLETPFQVIFVRTFGEIRFVVLVSYSDYYSIILTLWHSRYYYFSFHIFPSCGLVIANIGPESNYFIYLRLYIVQHISCIWTAIRNLQFRFSFHNFHFNYCTKIKLKHSLISCIKDKFLLLCLDWKKILRESELRFLNWRTDGLYFICTSLQNVTTPILYNCVNEELI